jgi:hypothetical protein
LPIPRQEPTGKPRIGATMIYVILAIIFVVLLFLYVRVRGRRLNR